MPTLPIVPTEFPHLSPGTGLHAYPASCDLCGVGEIDDILDAIGIRTPVPDLIPMYRDGRDGGLVCQGCAESGAYLEIETAAAAGSEARS